MPSPLKMIEVITLPRIADDLCHRLDELTKHRASPYVRDLSNCKLRQVTVDPDKCPSFSGKTSDFMTPWGGFALAHITEAVDMLAAGIEKVYTENPDCEISSLALPIPPACSGPGEHATVMTKGGFYIRVLRGYDLHSDLYLMRADIALCLREIKQK